MRLALALFLLPLVAHAGAAEVWPQKARRLGDGKVEYTYDLRPLKRGEVRVELESGDEAGFLAALPNEAKVVVDLADAALTFDAVGELEQAPLSPSFSRVDDGPFEQQQQNAFPALHPLAPKLLPSADLLLWRARSQMDGAQAALAFAAHLGKAGLPMSRVQLVEQLLGAALHRYRTRTGVEKDGAKRLAAHLAAAIAAGTGRMPQSVRGDPLLNEAAEQELMRFTRPGPRMPPAPVYQWAPELAQLEQWNIALGAPFRFDREGSAAALTLMAILDADPKLQEARRALDAYRDALFGVPRTDGFERFREASRDGGAQAALDDMSAFLSRLPAASEEAEGPKPFARAPTPVERFFAQLSGPEQRSALEELTLAVQDGRVPLSPVEQGGWLGGRDSFLAYLVKPELNGRERLNATAHYRERLVSAFQALQGMHGEPRTGDDRDVAAAEPSGSKIRLMVPPYLEVEPLPETYQEVAASWRRLKAALEPFPKAAASRAVMPDGKPRPLPLSKDADQEARLFHGLALLASAQLGDGRSLSDVDSAAINAARKFLAGWRSDPGLRQDLRFLLPVMEVGSEGRWVHSGLMGVGRRQLEVAFEGRPEVTLSLTDPDQEALFEADTGAAQRYQIPVLATGSVTVTRPAPLEPEVFRATCERAGRRLGGIEGALPEAMVRSLAPVAEDQP